MLRIDSHLMFAAVSRSTDVIGLRAEIGYLNRQTGEIRFPRSAEECGRLGNATGQWVEIPKHCGDDDDRRLFVGGFLRQEGIDVSNLDW